MLQFAHMKELLILRHAKSSWDHPELADHDRPLSKRGKSDAPRMGEWLWREELTPDLIISSTARRARTTAEAVAEACDYDGDVILTRDLYHADALTYLDVAQQLGEVHKRIMLVGHNPGIEELVEDLSGHYERMPTAAIAWFSLAIDTWAALTEDVSAELKAVWLPRETP
jgi:phosphohistidine phosphatase